MSQESVSSDLRDQIKASVNALVSAEQKEVKDLNNIGYKI